MINVEPSFVLYALLLDPSCCLRAHIILIKLVELEGKKKERKDGCVLLLRVATNALFMAFQLCMICVM